MPWAPGSDLSGRWSALHHGIDPASVPLLRGWLRFVWTLARPLASLRVPPTAVTLAGVALAAVAVVVASPWSAVLVLLAALCDGLDGAVAVVAGRATRHGALADAVADRVVDVAFAVLLWRLGASWWVALLAALLAVGVDLLRRVRHVPARITVAERPTWTICALLACLSAAVSPASWPVIVCAGVWCAAGVVGLGQLLRPGGPSRTSGPIAA